MFIIEFSEALHVIYHNILRRNKMSNASGIKKVDEVITTNALTILNVMKGGRDLKIEMDPNRKYIVPGYQREFKWSTENVQILIDDLKKGPKFLGTITFSTSKKEEYEIIDGQQRLTVISLIITYLNQSVPDAKKVTDLCTLYNASFPYFQEALEYHFDYEKIHSENCKLYQDIIDSDVQNQREEFAKIWGCIHERLNSLSNAEKYKFLTALRESELNVIVNEIDDTDTQRKFCVDYFIDINNKSVVLDSLDIIRAFAFKDNFVDMTDKWVSIQTKCNTLSKKVKYERDVLYYHYFICNVNKEIGYQISKLSKDYRIKENVVVGGKQYASGSYVWNLFNNDKFYSDLLNDLDEYLDFIELIISSETGGTDAFKKYFRDENDKNQCNEDRILNTHTIINTILRNDDMVPKMLVMKYYFEVLKPKNTASSLYKYIDYINVIATVFTLSAKRKSSDVIASKIMQKDWSKELYDYAVKSFQVIPAEIEYDKIIRENDSYTTDSGLHAARRYLSLVDACTPSPTAIKINADTFKKENNTRSSQNMEHFIINRDFTYALYLDDGESVDISINLPNKYKKYIATLANYILMDKDTNSLLKNRPVYEKIEMLDVIISTKGIDNVIIGSESQRHYYIIKSVMHDNTNYPIADLTKEKKKSKKKALLLKYYKEYFYDEYVEVIKLLNN